MELDKNYRGLLVEVIIKSYIEENLFEFIGDNLQNGLQLKLDSNLKFKSIVSDIETRNGSRNGSTFGEIYIENEDESTLVKEFRIN